MLRSGAGRRHHLWLQDVGQHQQTEGRLEPTFQNGQSWAIDVVSGHDNQATTRYIDLCLRRYGLDDCKPVSIPADANSSITSVDCPEGDSTEAAEMKSCDYRGIVGCLLYIAKQTRPGILATVSRLSRYLENPGKVHWMASKRLLRYLKGTRELGLSFRPKADGLQLFGACDADWASDVDDRWSTTGFAFIVQKEGAAISWNSKKQPTAAILSSEAEYQAMAAAVQEVLYLRSLLEEMGIKSEGAPVIQADIQSCIKMCKNPVMQERTKHIDIKHHFVGGRVEDGTVELQYCATENMSAKLMTIAQAKP